MILGRHTLILISLLTLLAAKGTWDVTGSTHIENESFLSQTPLKHDQALTAKQKLEVSFEEGDFKLFTKLYAQGDADDTKGVADETKRSFARVDEWYISQEFSEGTQKVLFGKKIRHWGALEARNITDVFNPLDLRNSSSSKDKLGVWNSQYSYFTDSGEFSLIIKHFEQDQKISANPYTYYFLPTNITFDESIQTEKERHYPSSYISYSASTEWDKPLDYAFVVQHGYDSQKYFTVKNPSPTVLQANTYLVNKFLSYNTLVVGATLLKLEVAVTDVIDDRIVSDYMHTGIGFEHEVAAFLSKEGKLGIIGEYYYYEIFDQSKLTDLDLYEVFQNDLFLGLRYTFNDADDSSFLAGAVVDNEYDEAAYSAKYETRLRGGFKIEGEYQYIEPSRTTNTAYATVGRTQSVRLDLSYNY